MIRAIAILLFLITLFSYKTKAQLPSGFTDQLYSSGWHAPTGITFDGAGKMYVSEVEGKVYVVENGIKTLFLDISEEVATYGDYGLLGFTLDPNFMSNGHVYLYYIVDRHFLLMYGTQDYDPNATWEGATIARVTRYTTQNPASTNTVDYGSRLVLIGEIKSTGFPITGTNHGGGGMVFANDGTLFIGCGDGGLGADYNSEALNDGIISEEENVEDRVYRCQLNNSLNGKIVRIDPSTGNGVDGNPFFDSNAPRSAQSRVWALGFRNPFRIEVKPNSGNPGILYVGDVGFNDREEINIVNIKGQNFGWPIYEGIDLPTFWTNPAFVPPSYKKPTIEWSHLDENEQPKGTAKVIINGMVNEVGSTEFPGSSFEGFCSIGGVWYKGINYPEEYRNTYIFADFVKGWIKSFYFDANENPTSFRDLVPAYYAIGTIGLAYNPVDQCIYYLKIGFNAEDPIEVHKIVYSTSNVPPLAKFTQNSTYGVSPLSVSFNASSSTDYENSTLSYAWDFGDGSTGSGVNVSHTFDNGSTNPQKFDVVLTVSDEGGLTNTTSSFVSLNNTVPTISSTSIDAINLFANNNNDLLQLTAQVSDNEEQSDLLIYRWIVRLYHDEHSHPQLDVMRATAQVNLEQVPCDGHLYFYRVTLIVTDSYGLSTSYTKDIYPNCGLADVVPPENPMLKSYDYTTNSFILSWNNVFDNVGVGSYEVFVNDVSQGLLTAQTLTYQYSSETSIENQPFQCYVKVKDLAGNENTSSKLSFTKGSVPPASAYLSDLTPSSSTNFFGPIGIDQSNGEDAANDGHILTLNGVTYSKGIGVHAASSIIYNLPLNTYNTFSTKIGIDDEIAEGSCGSIVFRIFKDNDILPIFESPRMTPSSTTLSVQVDISNTAQLKLVADISDNDYYCDHGDWADAKLSNLSNTDVVPPTSPSNLSSIQMPNYFKITWGAANDNLDTNLEYEILIDNVLFITTPNLQSTLPTLAQGNHIITVQAKDEAGNRAVSNSIKLTYGACQSSIELSSPNDNFLNNTITLKASDVLTASNIITDTSKVIYQSANKIELLPGFSSSAGSVLIAQINGCDN